MKTRAYAVTGSVVAALAATLAFGQWSIPLALAPDAQSQSKAFKVDFKNAKAGDILEWLRKQGVNFVVDTSAIPKNKTYTVHIEGKSKEQALEAIAAAMGLRASKKGDIYTLTPGFVWSDSGITEWSPESAEKWKAFGDQYKTWGPEFGKKFGESWKGLTPETEKELEELGKKWKLGPEGTFEWKQVMPDGKSDFMWIGPDGKSKSLDSKEFEEMMKGHLKDMPKFEFKGLKDGDQEFKWVGPDGKVKDIDKKEFEKLMKEHLKDMPKFEFKGLKDGEHQFKWMGPDGKLKELDHRELEKLMKEHMKDMPKFEFKDMPEWREHLKDLEKLNPEIERKMAEAMKSKGLADGEWAKSLEKLKELKDMKLPDMSKMKEGIADLGKLMGSLTPAQMEKMKAQGYLKMGDLSPDQRKMLGDWSKESKFEITFEKDGRRVTIKGD